MSQLLKGDRREQTSLRNIRSGCFSWPQITGAVSAVWEEEWQTLATAHGNAARAMALSVARRYSDRTLRELAQLAGGMEYPAATMAIRRLEQRLKSDKELALKLQHILHLLQVKK
jgi:hypothetical protein